MTLVGGDMDTYFDMCRWIKTFILYYLTVIHCKQSYFYISQGSTATLFR